MMMHSLIALHNISDPAHSVTFIHIQSNNLSTSLSRVEEWLAFMALDFRGVRLGDNTRATAAFKNRKTMEGGHNHKMYAYVQNPGTIFAYR